MSNKMKGQLWLMGFGLNLSAALIHFILHNYVVAVLAFLVSYFSYAMVVEKYINKVEENKHETE